MIFRKRVKLEHYIEERIGDLLDEDGALPTGFFPEGALRQEGSGAHSPPEGGGNAVPAGPGRSAAASRAIGALLWLMKYGTLSGSTYVDRRLAFLDLAFDVEVPSVVDRLLVGYDVGLIKRTYEDLDIGCKEVYTGKMRQGAVPGFIVSPLWAKNPDPDPVLVAARLFAGYTNPSSGADGDEAPADRVLIESLYTRFREITAACAKAGARKRLVWVPKEEEAEQGPGTEG